MLILFRSFIFAYTISCVLASPAQSKEILEPLKKENSGLRQVDKPESMESKKNTTIVEEGYNKLWSDNGSKHIRNLLAAAKTLRTSTWTINIFSFLKLCRTYEEYWYQCNMCADELGIERGSENVQWQQEMFSRLKHLTKQPKAYLELTYLRSDLCDFAGNVAVGEIDRSMLRFSKNVRYSLSKVDPLSTHFSTDIFDPFEH